MTANGCAHMNQIKVAAPDEGVAGCEDCLKIGSTWVHLRVCRTCGHIGCCDSSQNKHASQHFDQTQHAIMQSVEPGESWGWCYVDEMFIKKFPAG